MAEGMEKKCAREHAFFFLTIEEGGPIMPAKKRIQKNITEEPGVFFEIPSIAPTGCCFFDGKQVGGTNV